MKIKAKRKREQKRTFSLLLIAIAGILTVTAVVVLSDDKETHCVRQLAAEHQENTEIDPTIRCFDTQSAAIEYATSGQVSLPADASSQDIHAALNALYATSER